MKQENQTSNAIGEWVFYITIAWLLRMIVTGIYWLMAKPIRYINNTFLRVLGKFTIILFLISPIALVYKYKEVKVKEKAVVVTAEGVNVRSSPDFGKNVVKVVKLGTKLPLSGEVPGWIKTTVDNKIVFVKEEFASVRTIITHKPNDFDLNTYMIVVCISYIVFVVLGLKDYIKFEGHLGE
jgi:hypothetical protein